MKVEERRAKAGEWVLVWIDRLPRLGRVVAVEGARCRVETPDGDEREFDIREVQRGVRL